MFVEFAKHLLQISCGSAGFNGFFHLRALQNFFAAFAVLVRVRPKHHICATAVMSRLPRSGTRAQNCKTILGGLDIAGGVRHAQG